MVGAALGKEGFELLPDGLDEVRWECGHGACSFRSGSLENSPHDGASVPALHYDALPIDGSSKILLATDGSEEAELAARTAADLAKSTNSELHLIYIGHMPSIFYESPGTMALDPDLQSRMEEEAEKAAKTNLEKQAQKIRQVGIEVAGIHTRVGFPAAEIVRLAGRLGAGLIVMGSRGLGPLRRTLMGSVSDSVVRHAHCPVLVVRPEQKRSAEHEADFLT